MAHLASKISCTNQIPFMSRCPWTPYSFHLCGPFEYKGGGLSRVNFPGGYVSGGVVYHYVHDHQGNVRQVVNAATGEVAQENHYYPGGMLFAESSATYFNNGSANNIYRYGGKELLTTGGLHLSLFGARMYDAALLRFITPDPLRRDTPHLSSYLYCAANPVMYVDPTGMIVIAHGKAKDNILNTLRPQDAKFVIFDSLGYLDMIMLNDCQSQSSNFQALKALANSEIEYHVEVTYSDGNGTSFTDGKQNGGINEYKGITELPGALLNASPNQNVYVKTSLLLDDFQQVKNTAHELFGHAYFYELFRDVSKSLFTFN